MFDNEYWQIAVAVILPNIGGLVDCTITRKNLEWYESIKKPKWGPPIHVIGPVWIILYCGIGYASYLVYRELQTIGNGLDCDAAQFVLGLYAIQLALNWIWAPIFWSYHSLKWVCILIEN